MSKKVAINGFGRIGRLFLRESIGRSDFEVVAVNDLGDLENLAYLLKYDTVYGVFEGDIKSDKDKGELVVNGKVIKVLQVKDPTQLPWKDLGIDVAIEATGLFESFEGAKAHISAGAKRAVITAPAKDAEGEGRTILIGVNDEDLSKCQVSSNGSCTTNSIAAVMKVLSLNPGIVKASLSTVHAYTATQSIVDGPVRGGKDFRRGRAAAQNISPSTTGAAIAVTRGLPDLAGKFDGMAMRVPVAAGSLSDITFLAKRETSAEEVNGILETASKDPKYGGVFKVTRDQLVSSDILGSRFGGIVDLGFTKVVDGDLVKVLCWYDNEAGYVATLIAHIAKAISFL